MSAKRPQRISGIGELVDSFDCFLIDQFGVLRDGRGPYEGAAETLSRLKKAGRRIIILSNSGKRSAENSARLVKIGFDLQDWDFFLTSGETAWRLLAEEKKSGGSCTRRCLLISRDGDTSAIDGLGFERVATGADADVVMISASEGDRYPVSYYADLLGPAARRGVPCLCTNPDKVMLTRDGEAFGAGRIAELYEQLGGSVRWIGKPFPDIYRVAADILGNPQPGRVVCIGDSIEHDIAGAAGVGFAAVLVTTGILAHATDEERARLYEQHQVAPGYLLPSFAW